MNKLFLLLSLLVFISLSFVSCLEDDCENSMGANNCITYDDCKTEGDCRYGWYCDDGN